MDPQGTPAWSQDESWDPSPHQATSPMPQEDPQQPPASAELMIWHMVNDMRRESAEARQAQQQQHEATTQAITGMTAALQLLGNIFGNLNLGAAAPAPSAAAAAAAPNPAATSHSFSANPSDRPLKAREPRMFNGSITDVEPFIDEVETNIRLQRMTQDLDKTGYFSTYLKDGNPKTWYYMVKTHSAHLLSNFPAFLAAFRAQFADPNYPRTALRLIKALRQTGSCANYAARFKELLPHVQFSEQTKLDQFKEGLKATVRDQVRGVRPKPATFDAYVDLAIDFDNDLHEDELAARERARDSRSHANTSRSAPRTTAPTPSTSTATSSTASTEVVPMEVDAVKFRGPLTQEEKDRRRRLNLCMYCAGAGHNADACPNKSSKAKKRDAARQAASASAGKA